MRTVIGIDYGTQSARALLVDAETGQVLCTHSIRYPHGVMDGDLASTEDYESALLELLAHVTLPEYRETVRGICVDATSLTLVPVAADGRVICQIPAYRDRHHAQIKLWKCHEAQKQAEEALALARTMQEPFLGRTGGTISSEWTLPKLLRIRDEDPEVYGQIDLALDLCEFLTFRLTGTLIRSAGSMASGPRTWGSLPMDIWKRCARGLPGNINICCAEKSMRLEKQRAFCGRSSASCSACGLMWRWRSVLWTDIPLWWPLARCRRATPRWWLGPPTS